MAKIDLSKIKATKPATKEFTTTIAGVEQTFTIAALDGVARLSLIGIDGPSAVVDRTLLALTTSLSLSEAQANSLINADWEAALAIASEIVTFTIDLEKALAEERAVAEKN